MAPQTAYLRSVAEFLSPTRRDPGTAQSVALARPSREGSRAGGAAHAEKHGHDEPPVVECDQRYNRSNGASDPSAILAGERHAKKLAKLRDRRIKATEEEVARSLEANWREYMLFELRQAVNAYDFIQKQMVECDQRPQTLMAELPAREVEAAGEPARKKRSRRKEKNVPRFDLQAELKRVCGLDLTSSDRIDVITSQTIVAELGTDFSRWEDEAHFSSWLGLSSSRDISGGKVLKQGTLKLKNRVATALRTATNTLLRSDSYLGARFRSLRTRRGAPNAIKAMAR